MIRVDTRVDNGNRDTRALSLVPDVAHIEVIQIGLSVVVGIAHGILWADGKTLVAYFFFATIARQKIADLGLIVQRHIFDVLTIFLFLINIEDRDTFRQSQSRKFAVLSNTKLCTKGFCQLLGPRLRGIRQHDALRIIPSLVVIKLLQSLVLLFFQNLLALVQHQHGDRTCNQAQHQYADQYDPNFSLPQIFHDNSPLLEKETTIGHL